MKVHRLCLTQYTGKPLDYQAMLYPLGLLISHLRDYVIVPDAQDNLYMVLHTHIYLVNSHNPAKGVAKECTENLERRDDDLRFGDFRVWGLFSFPNAMILRLLRGDLGLFSFPNAMILRLLKGDLGMFSFPNAMIL